MSATLEDSKLVLCVEDSGSERLNKLRDVGKLTEMGEGIGLRNTRDRLRNLFGKNFELQVTDSSLGGLSFTVAIPATESIREDSM